MTRFEAARALWKELLYAVERWWRAKAFGGPADQTKLWIAAVSIPAFLTGIAVSPRITVLASAALYVWYKIEEKRK